MKEYQGFSYPAFMRNRIFWALWKAVCCRIGWHLWDEVWSSDNDHYLYCDACERIAKLRVDNPYGMHCRILGYHGGPYTSDVYNNLSDTPTLPVHSLRSEKLSHLITAVRKLYPGIMFDIVISQAKVEK